MPDVPVAKERAWLLDRLAELVSACGHERFVAAPILDASSRWFPDPWERDPAGVQVVARRLLWHAGLDDLRARVLDLRGRERPDGRLLRDTDLWFAAIEGSAVEFEVERIGDDDIIGLLSHEIGLVFHRYRQLAAQASSPFRVSDEAVESAALAHHTRGEAIMGSVTAVYLGFGLVATNASYSVRQAGELDGQYTVTEWSHTTAGGLPRQAMSYLCAVQAAVRGDDEPYRELHPNQAADFRAWYKELSADRAALLERLRLPPAEAWSTPDDGELPEPPEPFDDEHYDDAGALSDQERSRFNVGQRVFRVKRTRTSWHRGAGILGGVCAGMVLYALVAPLAGVAVAVAGVGAGLLGARQVRWDYCSDMSCSATLPEDATECPRCGGTIAGEIGHPDERLSAEDEFQDGSADEAADGEFEAGFADESDDGAFEDGEDESADGEFEDGEDESADGAGGPKR